MQSLTSRKAIANHFAYKVWSDARRQAAASENIKEWQRLNVATRHLDKHHPTMNCEAVKQC